MVIKTINTSRPVSRLKKAIMAMISETARANWVLPSKIASKMSRSDNKNINLLFSFMI